MVRESCFKCGEDFPVAHLRAHVECCGYRGNASEDCSTTDRSPITIYGSESDSSDDSLPKIDLSSEPLYSEQGPSGPSTYETYLGLVEESGGESSDNDPDIQAAISASLQDVVNEPESNASYDIGEVLKTHCQSNMITGEEDAVVRITVRRGHIWDDTVRAFRRKIDLRKKVKVTFLGESAVDDGGPRREFMRLLMKSVSENSFLLAGPATRKILLHNTFAMNKGYYHLMGEMIVMSITQGGPGPMCFAPSLVDYLLGGITSVKPSIADVPDYDIQLVLQKVESATSDDDLRQILNSDEFSFRFDSGVCQPSMSLTVADKKNIVTSIVLHYTIYNCKAELDELKRGLSALNFLDLMQQNQFLRVLLEESHGVLTADCLQDLFHPQFSPVGSNQRVFQEATMMFFIDLLHEIEDSDGSVAVVEDQEEKNLQITVADILVFATGASEIPPMGFTDTPTITFKSKDENGAGLPSASTCANELFLPTVHDTYEAFKYSIVFGVTCAIGFGNV